MNAQWLHTMDDTGTTPLIRASQSGRCEVANLMLMQEHHDSPKFYHELSELQRATCWGFEDVVMELIEDGADVTDIDARGETALHKAARLNKFESAKVLLENGADVNTKDSLGMTPLHWASLTGNEPMTELLLENYGDVYARDYFAGGMTPLSIARLMGYDELVTMMSIRSSIF